ncbi:MAG: hypothetical protein WAU73_15060 [Candidatus Sulfotelmatobacter sp.]
MKSRIRICITAVMMFAVLAAPQVMASQENQSASGTFATILPISVR